MGGSELKAPVEKVVFEEDLTPEEKAKIYKEKNAVVFPPGLKNLGNTCYMNSTVQCMLAVKELREALHTSRDSSAEFDADQVLTTQFGALLRRVEGTVEAVTPLQFLMALRERFPRFGEMQNGFYMQQDADECLRGLLTVLSRTLGSKIDELFSFKVRSSLKCLEYDDEPAQETEDEQRVLLCHFGTQSDPVSHIHQGVQLSMKEYVEKASPTLGRNAQYLKSSAIASFPPYLIVQFARFGYKQASESTGTSASKVKLTRKVAFSSTLDIADCCTGELKARASLGRAKHTEKEDARLERERLEALGQGTGDSTALPEALEKYDTGCYELVGIISHKGRTADGGHYVGWVLHSKGDVKAKTEDQWLCFDDDVVSIHNWKDIMGLHGDLQGGKADSMMAYINIYKKTSVMAPPQKVVAEVEEMKTLPDEDAHMADGA